MTFNRRAKGQIELAEKHRERDSQRERRSKRGEPYRVGELLGQYVRSFVDILLLLFEVYCV